MALSTHVLFTPLNKSHEETANKEQRRVCVSHSAPEKQLEQLELYSDGPRRCQPLQYGWAHTPTQFLQVLEYTQCDGVPVRVAGGAQE